MATPADALERLPGDPESLFQGHFHLPPLPALVARVDEAIRSGSATARQVATWIGTDAGLAADVLKLVNSAYYGLPHRISDLTHAVAYLGLAEIHRLVIALAATRTLVPEDRRELERFWRHAYHTALVARDLARSRMNHVEPQEVSLAALLHDVGKLIYLCFFPRHLAALERWAREHGTYLSEAEVALSWPSHGLLGAYLCRHWRLPAFAERCCARHELADLAGHAAAPLDDRQRVVALANLLVNLRTPNLHELARERTRQALREALGCEGDALLLLMADVCEREREVENFLSTLRAS